MENLEGQIQFSRNGVKIGENHFESVKDGWKMEEER